MATRLFSSILDGTLASPVPFDPLSDLLHFDTPALSAASLRVTTGVDFTGIRIEAGGTVFDLSPTVSLLQLTTTNVTFLDGSRLVVGDDAVAGRDGSANLLLGGPGDDLLNGLGGSDTMDGGAGNDTYFVDAISDRVIERSGPGVDTIISSRAFSLVDTDGPGSSGGYVENLTLVGTTSIAGTGNDLANTIVGNAGRNLLSGGGGADTLRGQLGADTLDGGAGADLLDGGQGNDVYRVDSLLDRVAESAGRGIDTILASLSFALTDTDGPGTSGGQVENLVLSGTGNINGTGNTLNNLITGNAGGNVLAGARGNDTLKGGAGGDRLEGGAGNDSLEGGDGFDLLEGGAGADTLDGGPGGDQYAGGTGSDLYRVDSPLDEILESPGEGIDTIASTVSFSLVDTDGTGLYGDQVENLVLEGSGNIEGIGNALRNVITSNAGDNFIDGGDESDTVSYATGSSGGVWVWLTVTEPQDTRGAGIDTLRNVENLTGSPFDDQLRGNTFSNVITGLGGNDTLEGDLGQDSFRFAAALDAATNVDEIHGFDPLSDRIELAQAFFAGIGLAGALDETAFALGGAAGDADDRIVYDDTTGTLYFDADGARSGVMVPFAVLVGAPALSHDDIFVI